MAAKLSDLATGFRPEISCPDVCLQVFMVVVAQVTVVLVLTVCWLVSLL
jgi:hypothetical protein